jgi:predicted phosphodiesterase
MNEVYNGVRLLNPGSATGREVESATMMTAEVDGDQIDVTLHKAEPLEQETNE